MEATPTLAPPTGEQRFKMTYEEYLAWSDDHMHAEWVDGEVILFMPPKPRHQDVSGFLFILLRMFVDFYRLGKVFEAPLEMKVHPDRPSREPDILFIANRNLDRLTEARLVGPADLIVEIISDESVTRDRTEKFYEYQAAGVPEYWLFDPRRGLERSDFWALDEHGRYRPVPLDKYGVYRSTVIPGFWLREDWLFMEELPDPLQTFGEIAGFSPEVVQTLASLAARGPQSVAGN